MLGAVSGCGTAPPAPMLDWAAPTGDAVTVTVVDRGWHTDIALPVEAVVGPLSSLTTIFPGARVLVFGFGDRAFFMEKGEPLGGMVAALFPGPGAILVTALRATPAEAFGAGNVVALRVPRRQVAAMTAFIQGALAMRADGTAERLGDGPYPGSLFFASGEVYDAFDNCNSWTLAVLRAGGLPVDWAGAIFASQVMAQARRIAAQQQARPALTQAR